MSGKSPVNKSITEMREYHTRYLRAFNSPIRRKILGALKRGCETIDDLQSIIKLNRKTLEWHLTILVHGSCVKKEVKQGKPIYKLTKEGTLVDYIE
ncbi:MAG: winged helix-turn-helix transcriptional regulator [Candidatus Bathyarchaeota archaeon]|nr:MAG: winged helix-turn-helix transcriptional regulator [Candidatus Bathyarchaeota archaeon]